MAKERNKNVERKSSFPAMEEDILNFWEKNKIFEKSVNNPPSPLYQGGRKDYVFYDGPPFGTGEPHYGHILSSVSKDVVPRYWTMKGYRVERRWGWDCHGLPIENIIEKDMKISGRKEIEEVGIAKFNEACRARVLEYADIWGKMVRRIGRWIEFENSYKTMDLTYMESVWWAFKELWGKKLVYEGRKVLLYCPRCETPISNFEVAMDNSYKDITEQSVYVKFKIVGKPPLTPLLKGGENGANVYILAWTTTPWTLPGNVALAVGKDIDYVLVKVEENKLKELGDGETPSSFASAKVEYFIVAKEKAELLFGDEIHEVIKEFKGKDLIGLEYEPLFDVPALKNSGKKVYYVAEADFVTTEDGTGIVHTAVVYGEDDYNLGLKLDLPVVPALDNKGHFNETVPQFTGVYFLKANKLIVEDLAKRGLLFKAENYTHSYPHCHRCETQLFYNAIPAWFLNIGKLRKRMLELNKKINWYPEYLKEGRFAKGIEQAPDWNISRNRFFATPIPVWKCEECGEIEVIGSVKELEDKTRLRQGSGGQGGEENITDIHNHKIDHLTWKCPKCKGTMKRISEVFDCWMESGSMSFAQMHYPFENKKKFEKNFPAKFISEYISQTRAWFYVMHVISTALFNSHSFENVVATGVILNEKGEKLSKSKKNYPDPWKVINEFGADALRFYLMNSSVMQAENLLFNEGELQDTFRKNIMILWNVYKFYEMYAENAEDQTPKAKLVSKNVLDKWIVARLNQLIAEVTKAMDDYNLVKATRPIEEFINDLSTWYLRRSRERFKSDDKQDKQEALATTKYALTELAKVIAPFMPFIAEQIWQRVTGNDFKDENKSVHLEKWPRAGKIDKDVLENMEMVRKIVELGLAERDKAGIKVRQPIASLKIKNQKSKIKISEDYIQLIRDEMNVKDVIFAEGSELAVELDMRMTPELIAEGIKRELVRAINNLRKETGMTIQDRAMIFYKTENKEIKEVFEKFSEEIKKDTLADEVRLGGEGKNVKINNNEIVLRVEKH